MKMAKMWDTGTPRESMFKHILQHIPVKKNPSISILKNRFLYLLYYVRQEVVQVIVLHDV